MAVAQVMWQAKNGANLALHEDPQAQASVGLAVGWLVRALSGDTPSLRSVAYVIKYMTK